MLRVYKLSTQGGEGQKMAKFCPRSCWMTPKFLIQLLSVVLKCLTIERIWNTIETTLSYYSDDNTSALTLLYAIVMEIWIFQQMTSLISVSTGLLVCDLKEVSEVQHFIELLYHCMPVWYKELRWSGQ